MTDNQLIAEFMGLSVTNNIVNCTENIRSHNERCLSGYNISQARYDSSWDWLMPVVEKITSIPLLDNLNECNYIYFGFDYEDNSHYVNLYHGEDSQINGNSKVNKIEAVYEAVVKFIKWYNKNK